MIELITDLPSNVIGILASGQVTANDYETVLIPEIQLRLKQHQKIRILYQTGPTFSGFTVGAMWDDAKLGLVHLDVWEKIAIVTDKDWLKTATGIFKFIIPCPLKVFASDDYAEAETWVTAKD